MVRKPAMKIIRLSGTLGRNKQKQQNYKWQKRNSIANLDDHR